MEQQARDQLKNSLVSVITDHLNKEHNKDSIALSLRDSIMEHVAVNKESDSLNKEFRDVEVQDVDEISTKFR